MDQKQNKQRQNISHPSDTGAFLNLISAESQRKESKGTNRVGRDKADRNREKKA